MESLAGIASVAVALGIGLLVGMERERHKGQGQWREAEGLRTFALTAVLGDLSMKVGSTPLLAVVFVGVMLLAAVAYYKSLGKDPGITSEIALLTVLLLGALCETAPALASALAVTVVVLLAFRRQLHHFVRHQLSDQEVRDALVMLAAALVVLPLSPDRYMGPFAAFNPHTLCTLVVLLIAVGALGHFVVRGLGARYGYAISAIAAGFASSTATVAAMGSKARAEPMLVRELSAAGMLSNLASLVEVALILGVVNLGLVHVLWPTLVAGALSTGLYGSALLFAAPSSHGHQAMARGSAFDLKKTLIISVAITAVTLLCAALLNLYGGQGVMLGALLGGLADAHAPVASIAALVSGGQWPLERAAPLILLALSSNSLSKCVLAWGAGGNRYATFFIPGQLLMLAAMWFIQLF